MFIYDIIQKACMDTIAMLVHVTHWHILPLNFLIVWCLEWHMAQTKLTAVSSLIGGLLEVFNWPGNLTILSLHM